MDLLQMGMNLSFSQLIDRFGLGALLLVGLMTLLPGIWQMPLLDRDEPRFSQATVEMMERGEWVVPYFNGNYRFDKPPLTYWWMRLHYALFSKSEFAARLHSVLSSLLIAVGIFYMGRRYFGGSTGWLAAFAWLTCFQIFQHGRMALADMPMIAAVFYACWAIFELTRDTEHSDAKWFWVLYLSLGFGFLAKGPIALAIPVLSLVLYRWVFWRKPLNWRGLRPGVGLVIVLLIVGLWGIPALILTEGLFWQIGMGKHVVDRAVESFNDRWVIPGYYLGTTLLSLFPWMALMGKRLRNVRASWDQPTAFLVSWIVSPYLVFLFYSTQLPHYVMPAFPALLIWMMACFCREELPWGRLGNGWFWGYVISFELILTVALVWVLGSHLQLEGVKGALGSILFLLLSLNALLVAIRFRVAGAVLPLLGVLVLTQLFLAAEMRRISPVIPIAHILKGLPESARVVGIGFEEPSLVFYTNRVWDFDVEIEALAAELRTEAGRKGCYVILERERRIEAMVHESWSGQPARALGEMDVNLRALAEGSHVVLPVQGLNFARMRWSEILVLFPMDPLPASS